VASAGGILVGALGGSLYLVESQSKGRVQKELEEAQASLKGKDAAIAALKQQLEAAQKVGVGAARPARGGGAPVEQGSGLRLPFRRRRRMRCVCWCRGCTGRPREAPRLAA
jgi:putative component of toxin-antitoxin plasmid stabilization module